MKWRMPVLMALIVLTLALGGLVSPALAQSDNETAAISFKNTTLWINPEYDDPRLLVMLEGQLVGATPPVRVKFLVPTAAEMYSAGSKDAQGKYTGGPPDRIASDIPGWDEISYDLQEETFRVEYYDPIAGDADKTISYDFYTVYPISNLRVVVQQPRKSTGFVVTPKGIAGTDGEGFTVFFYNLNNVTAAAPPPHYDMSYTSTGTTPSITPAANNTMGVVLAIVSGLVVIGGVAIWVLKSRKPTRSAQPRSERRRAVKQGGKSGRFCPQCGQAAGDQEKFCSNCGAKLRGAS